MGLNQTQCQSKPSAYLRLLMQLLPHGLAWQWDEKSAGRHLLAAFSEEMHRVHSFFCDVAEASIERFETSHFGWSFSDYEQLLLSKFGIKATVSDHVCDPLHVDNATADSLVYGERTVYLIEITVDQLHSDLIPATDVDNVRSESELFHFDWYLNALSGDQSSAAEYLQQYKQSHTDFCWRDRAIKHDVIYDHEALTVDNAHANAGLYTVDYHKIMLWLHPSWKKDEFSQLNGWQMIERDLKPYTTIERNYAFH